ncbi:protein ALWAYS EARLY 3 isoform X3 [Daucus carota subsp. sativus]|uniref:protein ALWAYS EARLY 3 isoform X3 n=1 Tax=Daucus carota subsp. sativus TaxID=79200 RepID=UPI0007EF00B8|nr:PREDICTED: protein ALWAYS EARLY 3-like isoform X3 [Daucus carota subsp. sativus]
MGPARKSRSVYKRHSNINDVSPVKHEEAADRRVPRKRKLSDMLGPQWSKEELEHFYQAYRKHGKDWKKVGAVLRNRSIEMVEALYTMNRAYLSLPEGTASVAGLIAMMTDHYCNLAGSDSEQESNEGAGTSRKFQKRSQAKAQPKTSKGSEGRLTTSSQAIAPSYDYLPLLKKKRSGGTRPRVVGKRTPRFAVSFSHENINRDAYNSPTRQYGDANDSDVGHENLIALAEASQRGGSSRFSRSAKRMVGDSDMDEDDLEGSMNADNEDYPRNKRYMMKAGNKSVLSRKEPRVYGKKLEVDNNRNSRDEIREACSGTEEQKLGAVREKSEIEVSNGKHSRYSQGRWKRSKKVLFDQDEASALTGLEALANAVLMPESTNDNDSSIHVKEESNEVEEPESLDGIDNRTHQIEKGWVSETRWNQSIPGSKHAATNRTSILGKDSAHGVSRSPEAELKTLYSVTKLSRKKQKTLASKVSAERHTDNHMSESQVAEGREVWNKLSKGKRSSQSASPMLNKYPENSSSSTCPKKEAGDSAISGVCLPVADQVDITNKVRRFRKTMVRKGLKYADSEVSDRTKKLLNCFSNHQVRRWCAFEWFYSAIDYPWFAKREFVEYLLHVGLGHVPRLTHVEWGVIRSSLGKPRRFSEQFLKEEKEKLNRYRDSVRTHYTELHSGTREGLPTDLARPLSVGQRVTAIHPKTREIHDGSVLTVDHNRCRVQFDRPELGVEFVMDIDCMPSNPLENMPTSMTRHISARDIENLSNFRMNGQAKDQRPEGYIKFSPSENLENVFSGPHTSAASHPTFNLLDPAKIGSAFVDSQAILGPKDKVPNPQISYSHPSTLAHIKAQEADVQAIAELSRALEKKVPQVLVSELREMNNDVLGNQKDGVSTLKDSEPFKKQYAAVLVQLRDADERQVTSALDCLKQRNTYQGNGSLTWPKPMANSVSSVGVFNSSNCSLQNEEYGSHVNEIVLSSRTRAHTMVSAAIQAFSSMKGGGNTFEKIEEAIDYVYDQIPSEETYIPSERPFIATESGNLASQELKSGTLSPLQTLFNPQSDKQNLVPSELIAKCVATLLMIQKCTERQFPPADVAQILDSAVTSLQPCSSKNLPVYADIEKCMIMIRNQIMALVPT